ncbi:hypothetical protein IM793_21330 [Pedobacter sp. MR2016-19]|uniref:DUF2683 family protein n=1 Tax=Pedobacter sp. MR2016-19 TaxID=2780089 RepID=UPI00187350D2|nr:DUF2683 family protein [Pedobacter sp. MR2016-19]MBE5321717.1 hypothetical protein [Pedobacter sp. MR2016-19]
MATLIVETKNTEQLTAVEAVLKLLKVSFRKAEDSPYDPEFVEKILQGRKDIKDGKGVKIKTSDLWK